jgi:transcriptional regulator with XRE-family HTH domain
MQTMQDGPSSENVPTFATLLKHYRRAAGLTQAELAERAGLSTKAISSLERGVNRFPRRDTLQCLFDALHLDGEQQRLLIGSRMTTSADSVAVVGFRSHLADSDGDTLQSHITHLRTSKQHPALVDALLMRAMIAMRKHCWRVAMSDLDEAITLAQVLPYPDAELKAFYIYGQLYATIGECDKAREAYVQALIICSQLDEGLHRPHIERALSGVMRV